MCPTCPFINLESILNPPFHWDQDYHDFQYQTYTNLLWSVFYLLFCVSVSLIFFIIIILFPHLYYYYYHSFIHPVSSSALMFPSDVSVFMFWSEPCAHPSRRHATLPVIMCFWISEFFFAILFAQFPAWLLICILIKKITVCNFM